MEKKEVILVTGSCGRIGTRVVERLKGRFVVVGFDLRTDCPVGQDELIAVDLGSQESVSKAFAHIQKKYGNRIRSVIHLAAYYSFEEKHSELYDKVTVEGTRRLLEALKAFEVQQFMFTSTMLLHKPTEVGSPITEDSPVEAKWDYPLSKVKTERVIHEMQGEMKTLILRIAGVYDDQCHSIPISHQIERIYEKSFESRLFSGDVSHGAAFVHMEDLVNAMVDGVDKVEALPKTLTLLIGEPKTMSYDQIQRRVSRLLYGKEFTTFRVPKLLAKVGSWLQNLLPKKSFIRPWMIDFADDHYEMNVERAKKYLGWIPKRSLEKTLPIMIENLKKDPEKWYRINGL